MTKPKTLTLAGAAVLALGAVGAEAAPLKIGMTFQELNNPYSAWRAVAGRAEQLAEHGGGWTPVCRPS